jgi:hypothetical protein
MATMLHIASGWAVVFGLALHLPAETARSQPSADAAARVARYVAQPPDGGRIALDVRSDQLRRVAVTLPARCENSHGGSWFARLAIDLTDKLALRSGGFAIQGRAANRVRYEVDGRLRNGAISGRVRLTYLHLDFIGFDGSYVCDTGTRRYRSARRR